MKKHWVLFFLLIGFAGAAIIIAVPMYLLGPEKVSGIGILGAGWIVFVYFKMKPEQASDWLR